MKEERGLTNRNIAEGSGVPIGTVSRVFSNNGSDFRYETLQPIIQYLGSCKAMPADSPEQQEAEICHDSSAEFELYERMIEMCNEHYKGELREVRAAHAERLERMSSDYEARLQNEQSTSNKRIREYRRWVMILAIALGLTVSFVFLLLVLDLFNPHIGWVQRLAG